MDEWANSKRVIITGIVGDSERKPFQNITHIMSKCDNVVWLNAICLVCKKDAHFTMKNSDIRKEVVGDSTKSVDHLTEWCKETDSNSLCLEDVSLNSSLSLFRSYFFPSNVQFHGPSFPNSITSTSPPTTPCSTHNEPPQTLHSQTSSNQRFDIGGIEKYTPVCRSCYLLLSQQRK